jgi:Do/DeqQ family serine protease
MKGDGMTRFRTLALIGLAGLLLPGAPAAAAERAVPQSAGQIQLSFAPVVREVAPAVVNVYANRVVRQALNPFAGNPFFDQFFSGGPVRERVEQSLGSGVIVDATGIIVTNHHVIEGAEDIRVALNDRREYQASVLLADARTDLAVLKIDPKGEALPSLVFGDSDSLQVGDLVLAVGDPFGVGQTVTSGIVSALARNQVGASDYQFFIQTDAAINPGNSGGALVDLEGRLVGINTSIVSSSGGSVGIGFAIPSNMVRLVVEGASGGGVARPWFGAQGDTVTSDIARSLGLPRPQGVVLSQIHPQGAAGAAGLQRGDIVLAIDGFEVSDTHGLNYRVATRRPGDLVAVRYMRDGDEREARVRVQLPPDGDRDETTLAGRNPLAGARVANLTPALADEMRMDFSLEGVVIISIDSAGEAPRFGFEVGDIIRAVNNIGIETPTQLQQTLNASQGWNITVQRGNRTSTVSIR